MSEPTIDITNPASWPMRMTRAETAAVMRWSEWTLRVRVRQGRFPRSDDGHTWAREVVEKYARGGIKTFEDAAERAERRRNVQPIRREA